MFKKISCILVVSLITVCMLGASVGAEESYYYSYYKEVKLFIGEKNAQLNDKEVTMDQPAYVNNGRTLVPFRFLGESLGAQIFWDGPKNQATLKLNNKEVKITINSQVAYVNGSITKLDVPAAIKGGRTFIPLRFVSESLGAYVDYFAEDQMIQIRYANSEGWKTYKNLDGTDSPYKYPSNWTVKEDTSFLTFTSPRGSFVQITYYKSDIAELLKNTKEGAKTDGWTLLSEEYYSENKPDEGICLTFSNNSSDPNDRQMNFQYLSKSGDKEIYSVDEYMLESDVNMDWVVMSAIVGGYYY